MSLVAGQKSPVPPAHSHLHAPTRPVAMPLNEGWVPVKARRLQDWQKLKKYVPVHKQGDVCPNGVPALPEKGNADDDSDSEEK